MTGRRVKRLQRALGWAAVGLALAWSLFAQLLWQVETLRGESQSPEVRLVVSAIAPVTAENAGTDAAKAPRVVAEPVLPDGEAPAPCQLRRSVSTDLEVLVAPQAPPVLEIPVRCSAAIGSAGRAICDVAARAPRPVPDVVPASLPRPPPTRS